jgi:hypothetical protein
MQVGLEKVTTGMKAAALSGQPVPPQAAAMVDQLQKGMQSMPQQVSTVPVAQDESENHSVEASECGEWLNSIEGQKFKFGTPEQQAGFANVLLHFKEHLAQAKKIAAANQPPPKPPSESISVDPSKMPANVAVQALAKMGIQSTPADFSQHADTQLDHAVAKKAIPEALKQPIA